ncbi:hypothetical protein CRV02_12790 [Arcobacter sp. CECT 8989]|uniref:hypothetical protein n=1 Tax=Arcobacter sp. CECT 8989 TaxID=2044509 RepID=UPI00100A6374|nr:hypothetical protein [Arcobacter sp. CECT 8989]RXJ98922.1 hypothetical protein CRV02_12790 [Arcobacter sp. CECT 8989]
MLLNKKKKILFLTKKSYFKTLDKVDIILSPEFYWVREFEIPVKNKKDALVFLPNLFSDVLPLGDFSFFAMKKSKHHFLCFAYKNSEILAAIKNANLQNIQVGNIHFAQLEFSNKKALYSNTEQFIYTEDEILVKIPFPFESNSEDINSMLKEHILSKYKIRLKFYSSIIDVKYINSIGIVTLILIFLNIFQYFIISKNISILERKEQSIKKQYNLPSTSFETNAILKRMKKNFNANNSLRQSIGYIFDYQKRDNKAIIKRIDFDGKIFQLDIDNVIPSYFKTYFTKNFKIIKQKREGSLMKVELKYE